MVSSYKGRTFCDSSITCARIECPLRLSAMDQIQADLSELPLSLAQYRDTEDCPGWIDYDEIIPSKDQNSLFDKTATERKATDECNSDDS